MIRMPSSNAAWVLQMALCFSNFWTFIVYLRQTIIVVIAALWPINTEFLRFIIPAFHWLEPQAWSLEADSFVWNFTTVWASSDRRNTMANWTSTLTRKPQTVNESSNVLKKRTVNKYLSHQKGKCIYRHREPTTHSCIYELKLSEKQLETG